jgi:hypothetical protein
MKSRKWLLASALALTGSAALAVNVGGALFIRAKGTKLMATTSPTANTLAVLQPGQQVVWNGADPANKQWHRVTFEGKKGVIFQANLSPQRPKMELTAKGGGAEVDPQAFASSGAATKALSEAAIKYAHEKNAADALKELLVLEALSAKVTFKEIGERNKKVGIFVIASDDEEGQR